jgi:phage/plasmid-like protein (TIGR03299 family)
MSANVETMMSVQETPWHGRGTVLPNYLGTVEENIAAAGLDWDVYESPMKTLGGQLVPHHKAIIRATDETVLGVVGRMYKPLQNRDAFKWFQPFLDAGEAKLETAGALNHGRRVWVLAKLNRDPITVAPGDDVNKYLLLSNGHDGTLAIRVGFTPIRVVCQNTLSAAHTSDASKLLRIRHSSKSLAALEAVRETVNVADAAFVATAEKYRRLASLDVNSADLRKYIRTVLSMPEEETALPTRSKNTIESIIKNFESGRGSDLPASKTAWGMYNALTEYLTWQRGRSVDTRLSELWYGTGARLNARALDLALSLAA